MSDTKEKIYLNGIPVYRTHLVDEDQIKYALFEDSEDFSHILYINTQATRAEEYSIVLGQIKGLIVPSNKDDDEMQITVLRQEYEQSKRDKQWLQKPTIEQTRTLIGTG